MYFKLLNIINYNVMICRTKIWYHRWPLLLYEFNGITVFFVDVVCHATVNRKDLREKWKKTFYTYSRFSGLGKDLRVYSFIRVYLLYIPTGIYILLQYYINAFPDDGLINMQFIGIEWSLDNIFVISAVFDRAHWLYWHINNMHIILRARRHYKFSLKNLQYSIFLFINLQTY